MNRIPKYLEQLRELLPKLRSGEIFAIEFGDPKIPQGLLSHHWIQFINTPSGVQPCFKLMTRGQSTSGVYMGTDATDAQILEKAEHHLCMYFKPTPLQRMIAASSNADKVSNSLCYFAVE